MELFQLMQFKAIVEYKRMTTAAEQLYISQPALSKNLSNLEKELGCKLFDRSGKDLILNENGSIFLEYADKILNEVEDLKEIFKERTRISQNKIIFVAPDDVFFRFFLNDFMKSHPDMFVQVKIMDNEYSFKELQTNKAAVIIYSKEYEYDEQYHEIISNKDINNIYLYHMRLFLSVPIDSEYAQYGSLSLEEITRIPLVRIYKNTGIEKWVDHLLAKEKLQFQNVIGTLDQVTWKSVVLSSKYNTLTSFLLIDDYKEFQKQRKIIPINDIIVRKDLYLCYYKKNHFANIFAHDYLEKFYMHLKRNII